MNYQKLTGILVFSMALTACNTPETIMANGAIQLKGDHVTLHPVGAAEAVITSSGTFTVDGNAVTVTPLEHDLLQRYYQSVAAVHQHGVEIGKEGVLMAGKSLNAASSSSSLDASSQKVTDLGLQICNDTAAIKSVQDQLAAQLSTFKPYSQIIDNDAVASCNKDAK